ncbi:MAG: MBL fold metallo-hydrolase [Candidatus Rokuibacteriota bacterium]
MRLRLTALALAALVLAALPPSSSIALDPRPAARRPAHHAEQGFRNLDPGYAYPLLGRAGRAFGRIFEEPPDRGPAPAVVANDGREIRANGTTPTITWIGHSTFLVQIDGVNILTDPIWSDRASPVTFAGPRRLVPPGMRFEDLPRVHAVVISHDHYDHLDEATVRRIALEHRARFFVPLGLEAWLADLGITDVVELDWWEARDFRGLRFVCTPAQHSSGRGLRDQNLRLWSSWAVAGRDHRLFFAGDTGYFDAFEEIGRRLGPFDVAAVPIGGYSAYDARHPNHVSPEEALTVFEEVRARLMVPMHFGTFELNREPFAEPPDRLLREARRRGLGKQIAILSPGQTLHWADSRGAAPARRRGAEPQGAVTRSR